MTGHKGRNSSQASGGGAGADGSGSGKRQKGAGNDRSSRLERAAALLDHVRANQSPVAAREVMMETGLYIYLAFVLASANLGLYGFNFHFYNFQVMMWTCLKLSRGLVLMIVRQCRTDALLSGWMRPMLVFKAATIAAVVALYLLFAWWLSTSLYRFLALAVPEFVMLVWFGVTHGLEELHGPPGGAGTTSQEPVPAFRSFLVGVLLNSVDHGFCVGVLPVVFLGNEHMFVNYKRVALVAVIVMITSAVHQISNAFSVRGTTLMLQSRELGSWAALKAPQGREPPKWSPQAVYARGSVVTHGGKCYKATADTNKGEPGVKSAGLLALVCGNPLQTQTVLLGTLLVVIGVELSLVVLSLRWAIYWLLLAGNLFAFSTCGLGLRATEHTYVGHHAVAPGVEHGARNAAGAGRQPGRTG